MTALFGPTDAAERAHVLREAGASDTDLVTRLTHPRFARAVEIQKGLTQAMHERMAKVDQLLQRS